MDNLVVTFPIFKPAILLARTVDRIIGAPPEDSFYYEVSIAEWIPHSYACNLPPMSLGSYCLFEKFIHSKAANLAYRHPYSARLLVIPNLLKNPIVMVGLNVALIVEQVIITLAHTKKCFTDRSQRNEHLINTAISACWIGAWVLAMPIFGFVALVETAQSTYKLLKNPYKEARHGERFFEYQKFILDHLKNTLGRATHEYSLLYFYVRRKLGRLNQKTNDQIQAKAIKGPIDPATNLFLVKSRAIIQQQRPLFETKLKGTRDYQVRLKVRDAWEYFVEAIGRHSRKQLADPKPKPILEKIFTHLSIPLTQDEIRV